ncbi:MAG: hypothetical protein ACOVNV_11275, partial [Pirellulaceae bacterium]
MTISPATGPLIVNSLLLIQGDTIAPQMAVSTPAIIGTGWLSHYPVAWGYAWQHRTVRKSFLWWEWTETVTDTAFYVNNGW